MFMIQCLNCNHSSLFTTESHKDHQNIDITTEVFEYDDGFDYYSYQVSIHFECENCGQIKQIK